MQERTAASAAGYPAGSSGNDYQVLTPSAAESVGPQPVSGDDAGKAPGLEQTSGGSEPGFPYGWFLGIGVVLLAGAFLVRGATSARGRDPAA